MKTLFTAILIGLLPLVSFSQVKKLKQRKEQIIKYGITMGIGISKFQFNFPEFSVIPTSPNEINEFINLSPRVVLGGILQGDFNQKWGWQMNLRSVGQGLIVEDYWLNDDEILNGSQWRLSAEFLAGPRYNFYQNEKFKLSLSSGLSIHGNIFQGNPINIEDAPHIQSDWPNTSSIRFLNHKFDVGFFSEISIEKDKSMGSIRSGQHGVFPYNTFTLSRFRFLEFVYTQFL